VAAGFCAPARSSCHKIIAGAVADHTFECGESHMIVRAFLWLTRSLPSLRRLMWRGLFEVLAARFPLEWWTFMNYGYHDPSNALPSMSGLDLENRYAVQLYHRVVDGEDLNGQDVLEIGCGRGGGAAALSRYWTPRRVVGVDVSRKAIEFCRRVHRGDHLVFLRGDAEAVPCPAESFDVVVNVESSFCYGSMEGFLAEVRRLLRPGGYFLYADIRLGEEVAALKAALAQSGLELVRETDITANVAAALRLDAHRRRTASRGALPWPAQRWLDIFLGIAGTRIPEGLANGQMVYLCYKFRKPDPAAEASLPAALRA
jgi:SAM-dependent methyltransferase